MTDLHYALLALAAVLLAALFVFNKWQERQALKRLDRSLRAAPTDDVLVQKASPSAAVAPAAPALAATAPAAARIEPQFTPPPLDIELDPGAAAAAAPAAVAHAAHAAVVPTRIEDPLIDWVLELRCAKAVDGVTVFDAAAPLARLESALPLFLVAWDARSQQWVQPDRFGFYTELLVATQLANRRHKLDAISASRFIATVQQVAMALDADFDAPDVAGVVQLADELDRLCARFDVQIGLTLNSQEGSWESPAIAHASIAVAQLVPVSALRWERRADGQPLFSLNAERLPADRLLLELDVPLAPAAADPLRSMAATAQRLAEALGAELVDDNGRPVDPAALEDIAAQLDALYAEMRGAGIEPGGTRARRLYA